MDKYKWYSSYSTIFTNMILGANIGANLRYQKTFLECINDEFSKKNQGYRGYLWVFIDQCSSNTRLYFSIDGKILECQNLMADDIRDMKIYDVCEGEFNYSPIYENLKRFVIKEVFEKNSFNMVGQIQSGKSIVLVQVDFDECKISQNEVTSKLRAIFDEYIIKDFGEM